MTRETSYSLWQRNTSKSIETTEHSGIELPQNVGFDNASAWYKEKWRDIRTEEKRQLQEQASQIRNSNEFLEDIKERKAAISQYLDKIQEIMFKLSSRCGIEGFG
jgi:hypothetical protein